MKLLPPQETVSPEFIKVERTLEALGFFSASSKPLLQQEKVITYRRRVDGEVQEVKIQILPAAKYGLPTTTHQDLYRAFQAILADRIQASGYVPRPISFTTSELLKKLGRKRAGGVRYRQVEEWFDVMCATLVKVSCGVWNAKKKRWITNRVTVFDRVVSRGERLEDGEKADQHHVWLSEWQIDNLDAGYLFSLDFSFYKQLRNKIAKTLFSLLHCWFYAGRGRYSLKYDELCKWLGLSNHDRLAYVRRQLDPSHEELQEAGFLDRWEYVGKRKNLSVVWHAGPKYLRQLSLPLKESVRVSKNQSAEKLVRHFHGRLGRQTSGTAQEAMYAAELVAEYGEECAFGIVDYAITQARKTNFKMRNLAAISQYVEEGVGYHNEQRVRQRELADEHRRVDKRQDEAAERAVRLFHEVLGHKRRRVTKEEVETARKYSEWMILKLAEDLTRSGQDLDRFVEPGVSEAMSAVVERLYK